MLKYKTRHRYVPEKMLRYKTRHHYNAFLEDLFHWDNEKKVFYFNENSWESELIRDEALYDKIIANFQDFIGADVSPDIYVPPKERKGLSEEDGKGKVIFKIKKDEPEQDEEIKISRGEESVFVWSIFYTIIDTAIDILNESEVDRSTHVFDGLEYIVIDDPVSSIDDSNIIKLATDLNEKLIKNQEEPIKRDGIFKLGVNLIITTHHPLFYNVLFYSIKKEKRNAYILQKKDLKFILKNQPDGSPFAYHILVKNDIRDSIRSDVLKRYHFNLFRTLLEKTANFLGYTHWSDCILDEGNKAEVKRVVDLYSHSRLSELESNYLTDKEKELFTEAFNAFVEDFKYQ